jgi:hypothetical protein
MPMSAQPWLVSCSVKGGWPAVTAGERPARRGRSRLRRRRRPSWACPAAGGLAEADAVGGELEAVAVEVVAVGHLEADFDGVVVDRAGAGAEGLFGRQRLVGAWRPEAGEQGGEQGEAGEAGGSWPAV